MAQAGYDSATVLAEAKARALRSMPSIADVFVRMWITISFSFFYTFEPSLPVL
jgi:hypothetical protein